MLREKFFHELVRSKDELLALQHIERSLTLKFTCKQCGKKHNESKKILIVVNGITHYPESVNGIKPVFTYLGDYYCDEDCFISNVKQHEKKVEINNL